MRARRRCRRRAITPPIGGKNAVETLLIPVTRAACIVIKRASASNHKMAGPPCSAISSLPGLTRQCSDLEHVLVGEPASTSPEHALVPANDGPPFGRELGPIVEREWSTPQTWVRRCDAAQNGIVQLVFRKDLRRADKLLGAHPLDQVSSLELDRPAHVPQPRRVVPGPSHEMPAVRAERHACHWPCMALQD